MNILIILLLILLGIVLMLIEFTILPGITIAGIGGILVFAYSIYLAFTIYGTLAGFLTLGFVLIVSPLLVVFLFRGKTGKKLTLGAVVSGVANEIDTEKLKVGDTGVTIGRLAPMGKARINDLVVEVKSNGLFVDPGESIKIIQIEKSLITVEPLNLK